MWNKSVFRRNESHREREREYLKSINCCVGAFHREVKESWFLRCM